MTHPCWGEWQCIILLKPLIPRCLVLALSILLAFLLPFPLLPLPHLFLPLARTPCPKQPPISAEEEPTLLHPAL